MAREPMQNHIEQIFDALEVGLEGIESPWQYDRPPDEIDPERFNRGYVKIDGHKYTVSIFVGAEPKVEDPLPSRFSAALLKATVIGTQNTHTALLETSSDLPADALGEVVADAMQRAWRSGEDPTACVLILQFGQTTGTRDVLASMIGADEAAKARAS